MVDLKIGEWGGVAAWVGASGPCAESTVGVGYLDVDGY
jgi:hypothetical protein